MNRFLIMLCTSLAIWFGCSSRTVRMKMPIQETTNNLPIRWPSDSGVGAPSKVDRLALRGEAARSANGPTSLLVYWTNQPTPQRWPGSSKRWPESWYFSGLDASTDLVTWTEYVRVNYATNCSTPVMATSTQMLFRAVNGIRPIPRVE